MVAYANLHIQLKQYIINHGILQQIPNEEFMRQRRYAKTKERKCSMKKWVLFAVLALLLTGQDVSVISMMGFVMLMGIVVNNGIVLVDCINRFRLEGMSMDEAIISAGSVRMRPVLMTAITTVLGLVPLALGIGTGAEMVQPVAIVCIGGLLYGTLTTLVVIPVMYKLFARKHMEKIQEEELEIVSV